MPLFKYHSKSGPLCSAIRIRRISGLMRRMTSHSSMPFIVGSVYSAITSSYASGFFWIRSISAAGCTYRSTVFCFSADNPFQLFSDASRETMAILRTCFKRFQAVLFCLRSALGDFQNKGRSGICPALHPDASANGCDDILNHRKAKPGSLSGTFCGVKRFKNFLHGIIPDTAARVGNLQADCVGIFRAQTDPKLFSFRFFHGLKLHFCRGSSGYALPYVFVPTHKAVLL